MSNGPDLGAMGREFNRASSDAAEALRRFAEAWNGDSPPPSAPLLSRVLAKNGDKPTD